jgi:hypothetical protein
MNLTEKILLDAMGLPEYGYHQTALENALQIIQYGFKTGKELGKGEGTGGVYLSPNKNGQAGVNYTRGNNKNVFLRVSLHGLKLLDAKAIPDNQDTPSHKQQWYVIKQDIEQHGIFPKGYDGVYWTTKHKDNGPTGIYEIVLTKEAANRNLDKIIYNSRGQEIKLNDKARTTR